MSRLAVTAVKATLLGPVLLCLAIAWLLALVVAILWLSVGSPTTPGNPPAGVGSGGDASQG